MRKRNEEYWMKGKIGRKKEGKKGSGIVEERRKKVGRQRWDKRGERGGG
jgi:hypothetical protein